MKFIKLTLENTGNETFVNAEKITDFQINSKGTATTVVFGKDEYFFVKETPEEILEQIKSLDVELELIQGVEMKAESTEFDRLEDFVNDVGIFHEVLQSGQDWQIVRLEKNDISMNFRFYKNKFRDWHVINKGSLLIDKNRNEK